MAWRAADQRLLYLLLSSLIEDVIAVVVGLSTTRDVWLVLETTFSHHSKARELRLKDDLQLMKRSTKPVAKYACAFKKICDQLHAIGRPVEDIDKVHISFVDSTLIFQFFLLLRWLSPTSPVLQIYSLKLKALRCSSAPLSPLSLLLQHLLALIMVTPMEAILLPLTTSKVVLIPHKNNSSSRGQTHSGQGCRPPHYQICCIKGHYADCCNQWYVRPDSTHAHLAGPNVVNWFLDTGASAHMTADPSILDQSKNYTGTL